MTERAVRKIESIPTYYLHQNKSWGCWDGSANKDAGPEALLPEPNPGIHKMEWDTYFYKKSSHFYKKSSHCLMFAVIWDRFRTGDVAA